MKKLLASPKFITIAVAVFALIVIPLTLIQVQNQQTIRQNAETILWLTAQSASTVCASDENGAQIKATFSNTEPNQSANAMTVTVKDAQSGKSVSMGSISGGSSKTVTINTGKTTLQDGIVTFSLAWTDGHSGTDSRTATYKAVGECPTPTPTVTPKPPTPSPTAIQPTPTPLPSGVPSPTPTVCPTLAPVNNVRIDCPNCP